MDLVGYSDEEEEEEKEAVVMTGALPHSAPGGGVQMEREAPGGAQREDEPPAGARYVSHRTLPVPSGDELWAADAPQKPELKIEGEELLDYAHNRDEVDRSQYVKIDEAPETDSAKDQGEESKETDTRPGGDKFHEGLATAEKQGDDKEEETPRFRNNRPEITESRDRRGGHDDGKKGEQEKEHMREIKARDAGSSRKYEGGAYHPDRPRDYHHGKGQAGHHRGHRCEEKGGPGRSDNWRGGKREREEDFHGKSGRHRDRSVEESHHVHKDRIRADDKHKEKFSSRSDEIKTREKGVHEDRHREGDRHKDKKYARAYDRDRRVRSRSRSPTKKMAQNDGQNAKSQSDKPKVSSDTEKVEEKAKANKWGPPAGAQLATPLVPPGVQFMTPHMSPVVLVSAPKSAPPVVEVAAPNAPVPTGPPGLPPQVAALYAARKAAEFVNQSMGVPGSMSADEKKKLLWGNKKATVEVQAPVAAAAGTNRWDTVQFDESSQKQKFQKLMGVKAVASEASGGEKGFTEAGQKELQSELERQYEQGLRRRDGRTVGLGL